MPRTGLRVVVEVNIHAVTAPGVWLPSRDDVYLNICLLGQNRTTRLCEPVFPLLFHDKIKFERIYYSVVDPSDVAVLLEEEHILLELIQCSPIDPSGLLLASYEDNARDFLFPAVSLAPVYGSLDREFLMERTIDFPGISPKIEFSTMTVIEEAKTSALVEADRIQRLGEEVLLRHSLSPRRSRSRARTSVRSPSPALYNNDSEDELRPGYEQPTISSFSRSRSPSPIRRKMEDMSISSDRPFVVRKLDSSLIGRIPGSPAPNASKTKKKKKPSSLSSSQTRSRSLSPSRLRSASPSRLVSEYCPHCLNPHTEQTCTVCKLYKRYTGRKYWGHSYHYHPPGHKHKHKTVKVVRDPEYLTSSKPILESTAITNNNSYVDDLVDSYVNPASPRYRAYSAASYYPYRSTSPLRYSPTLRDRYPDIYSPSKAREISRRVDDAIRRSQSPVLYNESIEQLADDLERSRDRSLVHLDDGVYWSPNASKYTQQSHRDVMNRSLERVYSNMYRRARTNDI